MKAQTRWTVVIVGFLAGNALAMGILIAVARAGQSQVIPDYYERAAHYDDAIDEADRSAELGWNVQATIEGERLEVIAVDATGRRLTGSSVHVTGYPRAHAGHTFDLALAPQPDGTFRGVLADAKPGVYDLRVVIERDGAKFATTLTVETTSK